MLDPSGRSGVEIHNMQTRIKELIVGVVQCRSASGFWEQQESSDTALYVKRSNYPGTLAEAKGVCVERTDLEFKELH